jgi:hypothetical protein
LVLEFAKQAFVFVILILQAMTDRLVQQPGKYLFHRIRVQTIPHHHFGKRLRKRKAAQAMVMILVGTFLSKMGNVGHCALHSVFSQGFGLWPVLLFASLLFSTL